MTEQDLRRAIELGDKRNAAHYGYLRHLMLLAGGTLTVLVSLNAGTGSTGAALWALRSAWSLFGAGILCGAVALYGEVWAAKALSIHEATRLQAEARRSPEDRAVLGGAIATGRPPWWIRASAPATYWSLSLAVICLVVFAWLRG
jgi:cytochrome c biogenesis protein CcdA